MKTLLILAVSATTILTFGCVKSPSDEVRDAYMAANKGDYMKASEDVYVDLNTHTPFGNDFQVGWDARTRSRSIDKIEILNEKVSEEPCNNSPCLDAMVYFTLHFKDGSTANQEENVHKNGTDKRWRLVWTSYVRPKR